MRSGILLKYWFSSTDQEQQLRFLVRIHDPMKQWKLSPMDLESRVRWEAYTEANDELLEQEFRRAVLMPVSALGGRHHVTFARQRRLAMTTLAG